MKRKNPTYHSNNPHIAMCFTRILPERNEKEIGKVGILSLRDSGMTRRRVKKAFKTETSKQRRPAGSKRIDKLLGREPCVETLTSRSSPSIPYGRDLLTYVVGKAVGGREDDPSARAELPFMNRLHPLFPDTSNR
jgi:hypothetical protein